MIRDGPLGVGFIKVIITLKEFIIIVFDVRPGVVTRGEGRGLVIQTKIPASVCVLMHMCVCVCVYLYILICEQSTIQQVFKGIRNAHMSTSNTLPTYWRSSMEYFLSGIAGWSSLSPSSSNFTLVDLTSKLWVLSRNSFGRLAARTSGCEGGWDISHLNTSINITSSFYQCIIIKNRTTTSSKCMLKFYTF